MASWDSQAPSTSTPHIKFEDSPADSFISTPGGDMYPSLFDTPAANETMNPLENVMTPQSYDGEHGDDDDDDDQSPEAAGTPGPDSDKKPTKKRKSWGQVLPEPKTNLPPRKRAKTEDEKEQRRVERVLRNRRAAQSSRERKRQEVEALEKRNQELETMLDHQQKANMRLVEELNKFRRMSGVVDRGSSPLDTLQPSPITLSQPLFGSENGAKSGTMNDFVLMPENEGTVDPASLSPELAPVPDNAVPTTVASVEPTTSSTTSSDVTQHPAVSVSGSAAVVGGLAANATGSSSLSAVPAPAIDSFFNDGFSLSAPLDANSWGTETQFSPGSDPLNFEYNHLDGDTTSGLPDFDFAQYLSDDIGGAASGSNIAGNVSEIPQESESLFGLFDLENQVSSETHDQQPQTGASSYGCDAGVIAVGV